jgi:hypothetical protein
LNGFSFLILLPPPPAFPINFDETLDTAIVALLHIVGEDAGGQFSRAQVVPEALAADPLPAARLVGAITHLSILIDPAFHYE